MFTKPEFKKPAIDLPSIKSLPDNHKAKQYVIGRKIPLDKYNTLYYAENFKEFSGTFNITQEKSDRIPADERLVIPFFDVYGTLVAFQGRDLNGGKIRYVTVKVVEDAPKIFGMNNVDIHKDIYVTEGPIDSLFLDNGIATADSNLMAASAVTDIDKLILVFDNEPRNKDIVSIIRKAVKNGYRVCLWPESIQEKDINQMIVDGGKTKNDIKSIIDSSTYVGIRAELEFNEWRKV